MGSFDESKANSNKAIELLEENKEEFKEDYGVLAVKYYLQAANICFIMACGPRASRASSRRSSRRS